MCEECNIPGFQKINDVEAKATNMYNTKTEAWGPNNESHTAHSGTNKLQGGGNNAPASGVA